MKENKVIDYANGNHYEGRVNEEGLPHGKGKLIIPTGCCRKDEYVGEFRNGKRNGKGRISYQLNGYTAEYEGEWRDNMRCGHGRYQKWSTGGGASHNYQYEGEWLDDKEHGIGVSLNSDQRGPHLSTVSEEYSGEFKNGNRHGHGKIVRDGFDGDFARGKEIVEGEFVDGKLEGYAEFTYVNGDKFEGNFMCGNRHGLGKVTCANGVSYEAEWDNGRFVFESFKGDASLQMPLLLINEKSYGFDYSKSTTCLVAAEVGQQDYSNSLPISDNSVQSSGYLTIVEVTHDSVSYEVKKRFDKEGNGFVDTIRRGETKKYEDESTDYATIYDEDYSYTSGDSLTIACR